MVFHSPVWPPSNPQAPANYPQDYARGKERPHVMSGFYGTQAKQAWTATQTDERVLIDTMQNEYLWRVTAQGDNVQLQVTWGTGATNLLGGILLPFVAFVPGQCKVAASKLDAAQPATAQATLTTATGGTERIRTLTAGAIPTTAVNYTALAASVLTIAGVAGIAVAAGATIPLAHPAVVTAGSGLLEHAL